MVHFWLQHAFKSDLSCFSILKIKYCILEYDRCDFTVTDVLELDYTDGGHNYHFLLNAVEWQCLSCVEAN